MIEPAQAQVKQNLHIGAFEQEQQSVERNAELLGVLEMFWKAVLTRSILAKGLGIAVGSVVTAPPSGSLTFSISWSE